MLTWLELGKGEFKKLKIYWYAKNYRGVHARKKIYVISIYTIIYY